jgi:cation:H+ antiporter
MGEQWVSWAFYIVLFALGLLLLERGADLFTDKIGDIAKRTGQSDTVIGLLTAGMEWEELFVAVVAVATGHVGVALGDLLGSNIANITGSFSLGPLVRPIQTNRDDRRYSLLMLAVTAIVTLLLLVQGEISRSVGGLLVFIFIAYVAVLLIALHRGLLNVRFQSEDDEDNNVDESEGRHDAGDHGASSARPLWYEFGAAFLGLALIIGGAAAVVQAAVFIARSFNIPEVVIGLTLVAVGTTLPDNVINIAGALKGRHGLVTANTIGSNIFNLTFALGLAALVQPIHIEAQTLVFDLPVLLGCTALLTLMLFQARIARWQGAVLLCLYMAYLVVTFLLHT